MKRKIGKRMILVAFIAAMVFSAASFAYADAPSDIIKYNIRVSASVDKEYKVTEEITAQFPSGAHQITKNIPMSGINITDIKGDKTEVKLEKVRDEYVITAGSDSLAEQGEETLKFTYNIKAYDSTDISNDEFDFVLLPKGWNTNIQEYKAHISLPKKFQENGITILTAEGDPISGGISKSFKNDAVDITGTNISAAAGLSCNIILPDSYWNGAATYDNFQYVIIGMLILIPLLIFLFWLIFGRDPRRTKGEFHYPPEGMTPMEMGYIVDGKTDYRDAASMIFYFANKGYLSIEEYEKGHVMIIKEMDIPSKMEKPFAVTLFNALFENGNRIKVEELDREFGSAYLDAKKELRHYYTGSRRLYTRSSKIMRFVSIILACVPAAGVIAGSAFYKMEMKQILIAVPALLLVLIGCSIMTRAYDRKFILSRTERLKKYVAGAIMIAIAAFGAGYFSSSAFGLEYGIGAVASTLVSVLFIMLLKARTKNSSAWLDQILGLKTFIKAGDYNTCSILNGKKPGYYYDILPYAYALDLMLKWSKTFAKTSPGEPSWFRQFGVTKEQPVELIEADTSGTEHPALPGSEENMKTQEAEYDDVAAETSETQIAVKEEVKEVKPQQKKGFLSQLAGFGDRFKPHPELDFIRKFNFDDFVNTIKSEIDRLSDGIVERVNRQQG